MNKYLLTILVAMLCVGSFYAVEQPGSKPTPKRVTVTNSQEFLQAIRSNTIIHLKTPDNTPLIFTQDDQYYTSSNCSIEDYMDGVELVIQNVYGLSIIGAENQMASILTSSQSAGVISFRNSKDISLQWLNLGTNVESYDGNGVLDFQSCSNISISDCELWGSGEEGLTITDSWEFNVLRTTIRNCNSSIMSLSNAQDITFSQCQMFDNRGYYLIKLTGADGIRYENCVIRDNRSYLGNSYNIVDVISSKASFYQCEIRDNQVAVISNDLTSVSFENCVMTNNQIPK